MGLEVMKIEHGPCPFEEGDRVSHKLFGLGTVLGVPIPTVSPNPHKQGGIIAAGWRMTVKWDDPERLTGDCGSEGLTKVSSPDTRPYSYWERQWKPIFEEWEAARRQVEKAAKEFRPVPDRVTLQRLIATESAAYAKLQTFWSDETEGRHP